MIVLPAAEQVAQAAGLRAAPPHNMAAASATLRIGPARPPKHDEPVTKEAALELLTEAVPE